jgi:predicted phage terminase large subunit-like protein
LGRDVDLKVLLLSRTGSKARSNLRFIRQNVEGNRRVRAVFPGLVPSTPWSDEELTFVNSRFDGEPSVIARGLGGSITGFRADILIVDDLIDKTNVMTETQREKVNEYWDEIVVPTLNPDGRIFLVGTRYHFKDFYARILETDSYKENTFVFPAFKVDDRGREVLDPETGLPISYWPERWPSEKLLERKAEITYRQGSLAWSSQYMADPSGYEGRLFKTDWLEYGYYTLDEDLLPKYGNLDYYMAIDPNISEEPKSDNTAICTLAVDRVHKDIYVLDFYARPLDFLDQVRVLNSYANRPQLKVGKDYLPGEQRITKIGVESVAYQKSLHRTGYVMGLPVVEVQHKKMDKITRLLRLQPHFENQRIKLPDPEVHRTDWWDEFLDEYTTFPRSRRDDLLDCLEVAVEVSGVASGGSGIPGFLRRGRSDGRPEAVAPWKEDGYRGILTWRKKRS